MITEDDKFQVDKLSPPPPDPRKTEMVRIRLESSQELIRRRPISGIASSKSQLRIHALQATIKTGFAPNASANNFLRQSSPLSKNL